MLIALLAIVGGVRVWRFPDAMLRMRQHRRDDG